MNHTHTQKQKEEKKIIFFGEIECKFHQKENERKQCDRKMSNK